MEDQTSQGPEKVLVSADQKIVFWGSQVRHCHYCGISQPFSIYAMHEQPDVSDDLNIEGIYRAYRNSQCHGFDPDENKKAHYMGICLFCKKAVEIDLPENVDTLWEEVDGYHTLAALTLDEVPDEPRKVSQAAASRFLRVTNSWFRQWCWNMSTFRIVTIIVMLIMLIITLPAALDRDPENAWHLHLIFVIVLLCCFVIPKLLAFMIYGNPLTPKIHAHLLPFSLDLADMQQHAKNARYRMLANAIKPLAEIQTAKDNKEQENEN